MKPLVSTIVTTYNRREMVKEGIESVLSQDFRDQEIIVVDDGSRDGSPEVIKKFKKVKYFYQNNQGISRARNQGLKLAQGEIICFLDSDDLWHPNKLSSQVKVMQENPEILLNYTDELWVRKGRRVNPRNKHQKYSGWIFEKCLSLCLISPSSVMLRKEVFDVVGLFDEQLPVCEDYDLWLRITARFPVIFIKEKLITKRGGHEDQLSHKFWGNDRFRVQALEKIINDGILKDPEKEAAIGELVRKSVILENGFRKREKLAEANYYQTLIRKYTR